MSASATAACADSRTSTGTPASPTAAATAAARAAFRPHTCTLVTVRTALIAARCASACGPVPSSASTDGASRASARVATAEAAAVRRSVTWGGDRGGGGEVEVRWNATTGRHRADAREPRGVVRRGVTSCASVTESSRPS